MKVSSERNLEELKVEAICQPVGRGRYIAGVASRLRTTECSVFNWMSKCGLRPHEQLEKTSMIWRSNGSRKCQNSSPKSVIF